MSVTILNDRTFSLIASYARAHPDVLAPGETALAMANRLRTANHDAFRERYPASKIDRRPLQLTWMDDVDPNEVFAATRSWLYNVQPAEDDDMALFLARIRRRLVKRP